MGDKGFKIKRHATNRTSQKKQTAAKVVGTVALLGAAAVIGWFAFDPVYRWVTNFEMPERSGSSEAAPSSPVEVQDPASGSSQADPGVLAPQSEFSGELVFLPTDQLLQADQLSAALDRYKAAGAVGVVFDLKDADGMVRYHSGLSELENTLIVAENAYDLKQVVELVHQKEMVPVGRLYAFRDKTAAGGKFYEGAVKYMNSNVNWLDDSRANGGKSWLNPNSELAQQYILSLVREVSEMGLRNVILDGVQFPEGYSLNLATYGNTGVLDKSKVLADFVQQAAAEARSHDGTVWLSIDLLSACGLNHVKFGENLPSLVAAAGYAILDVAPAQFGVGVTTEQLTLSTPVLTPYETVKAGLEASATVLDQADHWMVWVQAYTAAALPDSSNKPYQRAEIEDQVRAAAEAGIPRAVLYHPQGQYPNQ